MKNEAILIEEEKNDTFEKVDLDQGPNFQNILDKAKEEVMGVNIRSKYDYKD